MQIFFEVDPDWSQSASTDNHILTIPQAEFPRVFFCTLPPTSKISYEPGSCREYVGLKAFTSQLAVCIAGPHPSKIYCSILEAFISLLMFALTREKSYLLFSVLIQACGGCVQSHDYWSGCTSGEFKLFDLNGSSQKLLKSYRSTTEK